MEADSSERPYLFAFLVDVNSERGIFLLETVQCTGKVGRFLSFRFDGKRDNGLRNKHRRLGSKNESLL